MLGRAAQNIGQTTYPLEGRELLGVGNGLIGTMTAVGGLVGVVMAFTVAARVTPANALRMLAVGQAMVLAAFVAFALPGGGTASLWIGAVLVWAGGGLVFPATMTAVGTGGTGNPSRAVAVYAVGLSIGLTGGPLLEAGVLPLLSESLRATFAALLPLPAAATVLSLVGAAASCDRGARDRGTRDRGTRHGPSTEREDGLAHPPGPAVVPPPPASGMRDAVPARHPRLLQLPPFRLALGVMLTYQAPFSALVAFGGLLAARADGATSSGVEIGFAVFYAVSLLVRLLVVRLSPIRSLRSALAASIVATTVGVALLGTAHQYALLVIGMGILGAPHGLTFPLATSILAEHVDHDTLGRANARLMASTDSAAVVVPLLCGWVATAVGYRGTFLFVELPVALFGAFLVVQLVAVPRWAQPASHVAARTG